MPDLVVEVKLRGSAENIRFALTLVLEHLRTVPSCPLSLSFEKSYISGSLSVSTKCCRVESDEALQAVQTYYAQDERRVTLLCSAALLQEQQPSLSYLEALQAVHAVLETKLSFESDLQQQQPQKDESTAAVDEEN